MKELKEIIAENLFNLRQNKKYTQLELAEKINYTDKSVSKWERGDVTPPVEILKLLADIYGVTLDYLTTEHNGEEVDVKKERREHSNKIWITLLAVSVVWFAAVSIFVNLITIKKMIVWQVFVSAVPITTIVLIVFNGIWGKRHFTFVLVSVLIWSTIATGFVWMIKYNLWPMFILGVPLQSAVVFWSRLKRKSSK